MMPALRPALAPALATLLLTGAGCERADQGTVTPEPTAQPPRPTEAEPEDTNPPAPSPTVVAAPDPAAPEKPAPAKVGEACGNGVSCDEGLGCSGLAYDAPGTCIAENEVKAQCASTGGEWGKWGMRGARYCMEIMPDAGKACTDSGECKGNCVGKAGAAAGTCQKYKTQFGCYAIFEGGQTKGTICMD